MSDDPMKTGISASIEALMKPVNDIIARIAGPAADELGETFKDRVKVFRLKQQVKLFEKVKKILEDADIEPGPVAPKFLLPAVDAASLEDDEVLQDRWAALLANASIGSTIPPGAIEVLKQLSRDDATLLRKCFKFVTEDDPFGSEILVLNAPINNWRTENFDPQDKRESERRYTRSIGNVVRLGLLKELNVPSKAQYGMTRYAIEFLRACEPPRKLPYDPLI